MCSMVIVYYPGDGLEGEEEYRLTYSFLIRTILSRCSDKAPRWVHTSYLHTLTPYTTHLFLSPSLSFFLPLSLPFFLLPSPFSLPQAHVHTTSLPPLCSVCGKALSCLASAANSDCPDVMEAVKMCVQARTVTDPLLATPTGMSHDSTSMSHDISLLTLELFCYIIAVYVCRFKWESCVVNGETKVDSW